MKMGRPPRWRPAQFSLLRRRLVLIGQRERDDVVTAFVVHLRISAGTDDDVLLAVHGVGGRWRIDAGAGLERP